MRGLPCAARSLRPRQTHFVRCAHCVQTNGAKSVVDARYRARRKALCCSARPKGETNTRLGSLRIGSMGSAAPWRRCEARRVWCSSSPSDELSSTGLCGARFSAHPLLTSGGCLNAVSKANKVSSARPAKSEQRKVALAPRGPRRQGSLLCLLSCRYKFAKRGSAHFAQQSYADTKGGRLPGRNPGAASRSEQEPHAHAGTTTNGAGFRYLSPNGRRHAMTQHTQGAAPCPQS